MVPVIHTKRCVLRSADVSDLDALIAAVTAPEFPRQLPLAELAVPDGLSRWLARMSERSTNGFAYFWSFEFSDRPCAIGQVVLSPKDLATAWNIAFWLHPLHWGRGLASEVVEAVVQVAFTSLQLPSLSATVGHWNQRGMSILEKIGFSILGTTERVISEARGTEPVWELALSCEQWQERR